VTEKALSTHSRSSSPGAMTSTQIGLRVATSSCRILTSRPFSSVKILSIPAFLLFDM